MFYSLPKLYQTSISPLSVRTSMIVCPKKSSDSLVSFCLNFDLRSLSSSLKNQIKIKNIIFSNQNISLQPKKFKKVQRKRKNKTNLNKKLERTNSISKEVKKKTITNAIKVLKKLKKGLRERISILTNQRQCLWPTDIAFEWGQV